MGCLALNASYEPLTVVPVRRAVRLVLDRKAELLEADNGRAFRSEQTEIPFPWSFVWSALSMCPGVFVAR